MVNTIITINGVIIFTMPWFFSNGKNNKNNTTKMIILAITILVVNWEAI